MKNKTNLIEDYVNFVDTTKKQNRYFKIILSLIVIIKALFLIYLLFKCGNVKYVFVGYQKICTEMNNHTHMKIFKENVLLIDMLKRI